MVKNKKGFWLKDLYWFCGTNQKGDVVVIPFLKSPSYKQIQDLRSGKIYDCDLVFLKEEVQKEIAKDYINLEQPKLIESKEIYSLKSIFSKSYNEIVISNKKLFDKFLNKAAEAYMNDVYKRKQSYDYDIKL